MIGHQLELHKMYSPCKYPEITYLPQHLKLFNHQDHSQCLKLFKHPNLFKLVKLFEFLHHLKILNQFQYFLQFTLYHKSNKFKK